MLGGGGRGEKFLRFFSLLKICYPQKTGILRRRVFPEDGSQKTGIPRRWVFLVDISRRQVSPEELIRLQRVTIYQVTFSRLTSALGIHRSISGIQYLTRQYNYISIHTLYPHSIRSHPVSGKNHNPAISDIISYMDHVLV